ncbi:hypothetical protein QQP08_026300 [Theobroma cacao]|nr:hypothetical protein QQP08_025772 [Theobroma cacao]WRX33813.1 hypothetical protein QQP08_026300 [Theobroma cacao]
MQERGWAKSGPHVSFWILVEAIAVAYAWTDRPVTILPIVKDIVASGVSVWLYRQSKLNDGDTDGRVPVAATRYSLNLPKLLVKTAWRA